MGHWFECMGWAGPHITDPSAALPQYCVAQRVQADPGLYGYFPLLDRTRGGGLAGPSRPEFYMQIVCREGDQLSGIPEYLRIVSKPIVDYILSGANQTTNQQLLALGGGLIYRDVEFMYQSLGNCTCTNDAKNGAGNPWAAMYSRLSPDDNRTRHEILADPSMRTLTLNQIQEIQREVGVCRCRAH